MENENETQTELSSVSLDDLDFGGLTENAQLEADEAEEFDEPQPESEEILQTTTEKEVRPSKKILEMMRKEKELQIREAKVKSLEAEKRARQERTKAELAKPKQQEVFTKEDIRRLAHLDPDNLLKEIGGVSDEYLRDFYLNDKKPPQAYKEQLVLQKVEEVNNKIEQFKKEQEAAAIKKEQDAVTADFLNYARHSLRDEANVERFELVTTQLEDPASYVLEVIRADFKLQKEAGIENPKMMNFETAAQSLEDYLQEQAEQQLQKLAAAKKMQSRIVLKTKDSKSTSNNIPKHVDEQTSKEVQRLDEIDLDSLFVSANKEDKSDSGSVSERTKQVRTINRTQLSKLPDQKREKTVDELWNGFLQSSTS